MGAAAPACGTSDGANGVSIAPAKRLMFLAPDRTEDKECEMSPTLLFSFLSPLLRPLLAAVATPMAARLWLGCLIYALLLF